MTTQIKRWIGSNGEILMPLSIETYNDGNMISSEGTFFFPQIEEVTTIEAGNPIGLLLALTYSATP